MHTAIAENREISMRNYCSRRMPDQSTNPALTIFGYDGDYPDSSASGFESQFSNA